MGQRSLGDTLCKTHTLQADVIQMIHHFLNPRRDRRNGLQVDSTVTVVRNRLLFRRECQDLRKVLMVNNNIWMLGVVLLIRMTAHLRTGISSITNHYPTLRVTFQLQLLQVKVFHYYYHLYNADEFVFYFHL